MAYLRKTDLSHIFIKRSIGDNGWETTFDFKKMVEIEQDLEWSIFIDIHTNKAYWCDPGPKKGRLNYGLINDELVELYKNYLEEQTEIALCG